MSAVPRILAFAGSARQASYNKKLVRLAAAAARAAGADVTLADLRDYPMPLFDQDLESASGMPEPARQWKQLLLSHDALLLSAPEYNSSIPPLLKNAIDWASRPAPGEPPLAAFRGKVAALLSASPGGLGGLRGLVHVRSILGNIGVLVLPDQVAVPRAFEAFHDDGSLKDAKVQASVAAGARVLFYVVVMFMGGK
jgi:NAD(P)H-dependent FMN reductase